jgi:hypothetical protein
MAHDKINSHKQAKQRQKITPTLHWLLLTCFLSCIACGGPTATQLAVLESNINANNPAENPEESESVSSSNESLVDEVETNPFKIGISRSFIKADYNTVEGPSSNSAYETFEALKSIGGSQVAMIASDGSESEECDTDGNGEIDNYSAGFYWCFFLESLELAKQSYPDIEISATVQEKHHTGSIRWLPETSESYDTNSEENRDHWLAGMIKAAETLSKLSVDYPNLKYWTIDDFSMYICNAHNQLEGYSKKDACYTKDMIQQIIDAGKNCEGCNAEFEFYPVLYHQTAAYYLKDSDVLGANYGTKFFKNEDEAKMTISFDKEESLSSASIAFKYYDNNSNSNSETDNLYLTITVNDYEIYSGAALDGDNYIQFFEQTDIKDYMCSVTAACEENQIVFKLYAHPDEGSVNVYSKKFIYIWDIDIAINGSSLSKDDLRKTYATKEYEGSGYTYN